MGYDWTQSELWETFTRVEALEFLADIPPEPTWVPCCIRSIELRGDVPEIELAFFGSSFRRVLQWAYGDNQVKVLGLDQIRNRLRPRKTEEVTQEGGE